MDYQPTGQVPNPVMNQAPEPMTKQGHSNGVWYAVGAVVIIALGFWYFYGMKVPAAETSAVEQVEIPALTGGNTTADISADLSQIPDDSAALNQDASASAQVVSGF
ncbi:MAG: hypothetical protein Q7R59_01655 [bacterium]|nr:hypothetical protein [bacterium]